MLDVKIGLKKITDNKESNSLIIRFYLKHTYFSPTVLGCLPNIVGVLYVPLDNVENYEIINYVNDLSLQNVEVLMTSDQNGKYTNAYTYGLDRISADNLSVANNVKTDPLYYLYDGRGSVSDVINTKGQVRDKYNYEAYGVTSHGGQLGSSDTHYENYYGYNGEDTNRLSGLQNLRARYYEPETGSFLTRDSYMGSIIEPLSLNRYTYGQSNPMMNTDPSGHWPQWLKNLGKNITKAASNIISGAKKIVSNVKSFVSKAVTTARNTVKSGVNSIRKTVRKGVTNVKTSAEKKINYAKASVRDTVQKVKQLSKPMITTRNFANEIVRNTIESVKKTCEGAQYIASKAYEYKDEILDGVKLVGKGSL